MKHLFRSIIFFSILSSNLQAQQNYDSYYSRILKIEEVTSTEDFNQSLELYLKLFRDYKVVFARDAYNACQLAGLVKHGNFDTFFLICAKAGVEKSKLEKNVHIFTHIQGKSKFDSIFNYGHAEFISRIDTNLRTEFIYRFNLEQKNKGLSTYKTICYDNFNRILVLSKQGRFPGEKLIGVNPKDLENGYVFATLKHYPYSFVALEPYLQSASSSGEIQPMALAYLYGFNQTRNSILYEPSMAVDTVNFRKCYNMPFGIQSANILKVNEERKKNQLISIEVMDKLNLISQKYKLDYLFGF